MAAEQDGSGVNILAVWLLVILVAMPVAGWSAPCNGTVVAGDAVISNPDAVTTRIDQSSTKAVIDWRSFSVDVDELVEFRQPDGASVILNRVTGDEVSTIFGRMRANGQVFLLNPHGVVFALGSRIDVHGLFASTSTISTADFMSGYYHFRNVDSADGATVINCGNLSAADGGYIVLAGDYAVNSGVIQARLGRVELASGSYFTLDIAGNNLIGLAVDGACLADYAGVENMGTIAGDGATVVMTASVAEDLLAGVVNNSGVIKAQSIDVQNGEIVLRGTAASVNNSGVLDVSGGAAGDCGGNIAIRSTRRIDLAATSRISADGVHGGNVIVKTEENGVVTGALSARGYISADGNGAPGHGGFVETSAADVDLNGVKVTAVGGEWLIDPVSLGDGFTIAPTGGDITGNDLSTSLHNNDVIISSVNGSGNDGHIHVNDTVTSDGGYTLTINATNDININKQMEITGDGVLFLHYGNEYHINAPVNLEHACTFKTKHADDAEITYTTINALGTETSSGDDTLQGIRGNLSGNYVLGNDIDASGTASWDSGSGFTPLGDEATAFGGRLEGLGHKVGNLHIFRDTHTCVAMFGVTGVGGVIANLGLDGGDITGGYSAVAALVGVNNGIVNNCYSSANVTVNGTAVSDVSIGGLVGKNFGTIKWSHADANVEDVLGATAINIGGLAGYNGSDISKCYTTAAVVVTLNSSSATAGGLVGTNVGGNITDCYSEGAVTDRTTSQDDNKMGGLVGNNAAGISASYATGDVTVNGGSSSLGGLIGFNDTGGSADKCYSSGAVNSVGGAGNVVGGLIGSNNAAAGITDCYWNKDNSTQAASAGGAGLNDGDMKKRDSFPTWDMAKTGDVAAKWRIYEGHTEPLLTCFMTPLELADAPDATVVYNGAAQYGGTTANTQVLGSAATGIDAGFYNGYYSTQQGYNVNGGNLTITPAPVGANTISLYGTRSYDGTVFVDASVLNLDGLVGNETLILTGQGLMADKNVGVNKPLDLNTLTLHDGANGGLAANYTFVGGTHVVTITPANLEVHGLIALDKVYDGTALAPLGGQAVVTPFGNDIVMLEGVATGYFGDKNVGNEKPVTVGDYHIRGVDAANYRLVQHAALVASVTPADLEVHGLVAKDKVYDATVFAPLGGTAGITPVAGDDVVLTGTALGQFADKNVGSNKAVTVSGNSISGADAGNYRLVQQQGLAADVTPKDIEVHGLVAVDRVYDATAVAPLTGVAAVTPIAGDDVFATGRASGCFADKNVGSNKAVTVSGNSISGADAGNYRLVQQQGLTADVTPRGLAVHGLIALDKPYDGATVAPLGGVAAITPLADDDVVLGGTPIGRFADPNVGSNKAVTVSGNAISGTDADNYNLVQQQGLYANIVLPPEGWDVVDTITALVTPQPEDSNRRDEYRRYVIYDRHNNDGSEDLMIELRNGAVTGQNMVCQ